MQINKVDALPGSGAWPAYNERFQRMWDFYLANCEAEFTTGHFGLGQFILRCPSKDYRGEVRAAAISPNVHCLIILFMTSNDETYKRHMCY